MMNVSGGEQGYNFSRLWLNSHLNKIDSWNLVNYEKRYNLICERFLKVWSLPTVEIPQENESAEQSIYDAESPTFKKLEYFIFLENKKEESAIAMMYQHVLQELYNLNPELLLNNDILKITHNKEDFRSHGEIGTGYYVEYNIDSNTKFNIIKKLLTLYDLEDELRIKYAEESVTTPNRYNLRKEFWTQLLPKLTNTNLYSNVNPGKDHWLAAGAGTSGVHYSLVVVQRKCQIELSLASSSKEKNKQHFNYLKNHQEKIENTFGNSLIWQELADKKMSRIKFQCPGLNVYNREDWDDINKFFIEHLENFEKAFEQTILKNETGSL